MIKSIVFDVGQVLASFHWRQFIREQNPDEAIAARIGKATVEGPYWDDLDRGVLPLSEVVKLFVSLDPELEPQIRRFFNTRSDIVREYDYTEQWIRELKGRGYHVYLLSNFSEDAYLYLAERSTFPKLVDGGIISYEVKVIKPEPVFYQMLFQKYNLRPEECVFLDDREVNVKAAREQGMHAIQFFGYEQGKAELEEVIKKES